MQNTGLNPKNTANAVDSQPSFREVWNNVVKDEQDFQKELKKQHLELFSEIELYKQYRLMSEKSMLEDDTARSLLYESKLIELALGIVDRVNFIFSAVGRIPSKIVFN